MAQLALAVAGQVIGGQIGGGLGGAIGFALGSFIGGRLFGDKQVTEGPRVEDLEVDSASHGVPIPIHYGTNRIAGQLIWVKGNRIDEVRVEEEVGKGGLFSGPTQVSYLYFATFAVAVCEGPVQAVRRIWADTKLIYDSGGANLATALENNGTIGPVTIPEASVRAYAGTETQQPDPDIQAEKGATTPAHRGLCYIVFDNFALANYGNRIPNIQVEVVAAGTGSNPSRTLPAGLPVSGPDAFHIDPFEPFIWATSSNRIQKIDLTTLSIVDDRDLTGAATFAGDTPAADDLGNLYIYGGSTLPGTGILYRIDKESLTVLNAVPDLDGRGTAIFRHWPPDDRYLVTVGWQDTSVGINLFRAGDAGFLQLMPQIQVPNAKFAEVDPDQNLWVVSSVPGSPIGSELRKYTLGGTQSDLHEFDAALDRTLDLTSHFGNGLARCMWWADEGVLILGGGGVIAKFDPETLTITQKIDYGTNSSEAPYAWQLGPRDGIFWFLTSVNDMREIELSSMTTLRTLNATALWSGDGNGETISGLGCIPDFDAFLAVKTSNQGSYVGFIDRVDPLDVTVASIIQDQSARAGLSAAQIDTLALSDTIRGYTIGRTSTARRILEPLLQGFLIDATEADNKVKFLPRTGTAVATIAEDDLGAGAGNAEDDDLIETVTQEVELPERVNVKYIAHEAEYEQGVQHAKRAGEAVDTVEQVTFDAPYAISDTVAKRMAERILFSAWAERTGLRFRTLRKHMRVHPADVVSLSRGAANYLARITQITDGAVLGMRAVAIEPAALVSIAAGAAANVSAQTLQLLSPTSLFLIDSTLLRDQDNDALFYIGVAPRVNAALWTGAQVFKSSDGATFDPWDSWASAVDHGVATTPIGPGPTTIFDRVNSLTVAMSRGAPATDSELNVLNGANAALLQAGTDWEVIQWAEATDNGNGTYTLTTLLRGGRGTEHLVGAHASGDRFIPLSAATLRRKGVAEERGLARFYKAMTFGAVFDPRGGTSFTNTGRGLRPLAPVHVTASRSAGDVTVGWTRRTRIGGAADWADGVTAVPLGEDNEAYEIDILDPVGSPTVVRTLAVSSPTATYTAAEQAADFGSPTPTEFNIVIYQMSATFGRGVGQSATI